MALRDEFYCALLACPEELDIYAEANYTCYRDKLLNPSVDDKGADNVIRQARNHGISYWKDLFLQKGLNSFVLFYEGNTEAKPIGVASVLLPTDKNKQQIPLMCSAHILKDFRSIGLSGLLIDSCLKYISEQTSYNDVHVLAHKDNSPSIRGLTKRGFFVLRRGEKYITFLGRIPAMHPRSRLPESQPIPL